MNKFFLEYSYKDFTFYALLVIVSLNIFRSSRVYLAVYILLSLAVSIYFILNWDKFYPKSVVGRLSILYILASCGVAIVSVVQLNFSDFFTATTRFYFVYPLFFCALIFLNKSTFRVAIQIYLIVVALAACCLIYQVYFGPITYFAEHSNRAGIPRYATFLGALPTFGVAGGFALLFIGFAFRNIPLFLGTFFLIFTGLIITLQKAALANLAIVLIFMFWMSFKGKLCVSPKKMFGIFLAAGAFNFFALNDYVLVNLDFLGMKLHRSNGDVIGWTGYGMGEDAQMRISNHFLKSHSATSAATQIPLSSISNFSFFGVGYEALGGALGLEQYPMSHNGIVDIWRLGGVPYATVFLLLFLGVVCKLVYLKHSDEYSCFAQAFFALFILNFIFYTGIFVNPSLSMLFWINLAYLSVKQDAS